MRNMELKEQINKGLEENADNLSDQISFSIGKFARQTNWKRQSNWTIADGTISTVDRYREVLHQNLSDNRDRSRPTSWAWNKPKQPKLLKDMQDSNETFGTNASDSWKRNLGKPYKHVYKPLLRQFQDSWSRLMGAWVKWKIWPRMLEILTRSFQIQKHNEAFWEASIGQIIEDILTVNQYERISYGIRFKWTSWICNQNEETIKTNISTFPLILSFAGRLLSSGRCLWVW